MSEAAQEGERSTRSRPLRTATTLPLLRCTLAALSFTQSDTHLPGTTEAATVDQSLGRMPKSSPHLAPSEVTRARFRAERRVPCSSVARRLERRIALWEAPEGAAGRRSGRAQASMAGAAASGADASMVAGYCYC